MNRLYTNVFATNMARGMARVALSWVMLQRYGAFGLSAAVLSMSVGQFLGSLVAGNITDKVNRKNVVRETSWISGIGFALIGAGFSSQLDNMFLICAFALVVNILLSVHDNATRTLIPSIASTEKIERANGHFITTSEVGSFIGPIITGWLIGLYRADTVIFLAGGSCVIGAAVINGLTMEMKAHLSQRGLSRSTSKHTTISFLRKNTWFVFGLLLAVLANVFIVPISLVLVPLRIKEVGLGAVELGYFYAALSVGFAATGLLKVGDLWSKMGDLRLAAFLAAGSIIYVLTFYFNILPFVLVCGLGAGLFLAKFEISWNSLMQRRTSPDMLGRVYGLGSWTSFAGRAVGVSAIGLLVAGTSVQVLTLGMIFCFLTTLVIVVALTQTKTHSPSEA